MTKRGITNFNFLHENDTSSTLHWMYNWTITLATNEILSRTRIKIIPKGLCSSHGTQLAE